MGPSIRESQAIWIDVLKSISEVKRTLYKTKQAAGAPLHGTICYQRPGADQRNTDKTLEQGKKESVNQRRP